MRPLIPHGARRRPRRAFLAAALAAAALAAPVAQATPPTAPPPHAAAAAQVTATTDWSVALVTSTMKRYTPATIGGWSYPVALYLYGQYLVYKRTHNPAYLAYIKSWADRFVDSSGHIANSFDSLDSMEPGRVLVALHHETGDPRYAAAAKQIHDRLATYPRTTDGGFWHATTSSRAHQLWGDGTFMLNPFLIEYGIEFGDTTATRAETVKQLTVYAAHLQQPSGLLRHAYDESKAASWADQTTGLSPEVWCRADGWYAMAIVDVLDKTPSTQPGRAQLLGILQRLAAGIEKYQDPGSGRWFQVVDKGTSAGDWTETSCSSMFTFALSRAAQQGYIDAHYATDATRGYQGVLARMSVDSSGLTNLTTISIGTNVGDYAYYIARTRATNDFHGLGAFLIMNEQLAGH